MEMQVKVRGQRGHQLMEWQAYLRCRVVESSWNREAGPTWNHYRF